MTAPKSLRQPFGGWPEPDIIIIEDYVQSANATMNSGRYVPECALRLHMEIPIEDPNDVKVLRDLIAVRDNAGIVKKVLEISTIAGSSRGPAFLKAALGELTPADIQKP